MLDPDFEEYFHSEQYEIQRQLEAGGCEGCMRACWIDTSSMFRTFEGFFDTAKMMLKPDRRQPLSWSEAQARAKVDPAT